MFCKKTILPFGSHQAPLYRGSRQPGKGGCVFSLQSMDCALCVLSAEHLAVFCVFSMQSIDCVVCVLSAEHLIVFCVLPLRSILLCFVCSLSSALGHLRVLARHGLLPGTSRASVCRRWGSNRSGKCSQERLTRGTVTSTMRRAAHPPGCARCGAGAG